ncbi:MAG TPA: MFS transporter [Candidatus Acidoferrales bacterium]|nr:MFS transporter [Candidatus Acidoferrales bacterium]
MGGQPQIESRDPGSSPVRPWASFLVRDFALLWSSSALTAIASQLRQVAQLYQVYEISGSSLKLGLAGLLHGLPYVLLGLFAGTVADTFDRKKLILFTQCLNLIPAAALGLLTMAGAVQVWHVYLFGVMSAFVQVFNGPARSALVPRLVPQSHLMNAVSLNALIHQASMLIGPAAAGLLIDLLGVSWTYFICGALFVPAAFGVIAIRTSGEPRGERRRVSLRSMIEGVEFIWVQRIILSLFLLDFGVMLVGYYNAVLPIFASDVFKAGAVGLGTLYTASALGALLGLGTLLLLGEVRRKGALALTSAVLFAGALTLLGLARWFWLGVLAVAALGFFDAISVSVRRTVIQLLAPDAMMGRAWSLMAVFAQLTNGLGALVVGAMAAALGAPKALVASGGLCLLIVVIIGCAIPQLWRYRSD